MEEEKNVLMTKLLNTLKANGIIDKIRENFTRQICAQV